MVQAAGNALERTEKFTGPRKVQRGSRKKGEEPLASVTHGSSLRAALRRKGVWPKANLNLNRDLAEGYLKELRPFWTIFTKGEERFIVTEIITIRRKFETKLRETTEAADNAIADQIQGEATLALDAARASTNTFLKDVLKNVGQLRKDVHRALEPWIKEQLDSVYVEAREEKGKGAAQRQREIVCDRVSAKATELYKNGSDKMMRDLQESISTCGAFVQDELQRVGNQIEGSFAVLGGSDDPDSDTTKFYQLAHGSVHSNLFFVKRLLDSLDGNIGGG
ncbi:hypothetical protein SCHPADRAFT_933874 [Schizopora paradoxa]|uniref:DUF7605 domain-containing protein n=1 Tax=Schizopora paradoxa TaxID=27342 RepID=A0A0H2R0S9_9AGAM|nr:hypothetical protein SCHPADRAFT_933874 [Schizopora paradoxa]